MTPERVREIAAQAGERIRAAREKGWQEFLASHPDMKHLAKAAFAYGLACGAEYAFARQEERLRNANL